MSPEPPTTLHFGTLALLRGASVVVDGKAIGTVSGINWGQALCDRPPVFTVEVDPDVKRPDPVTVAGPNPGPGRSLLQVLGSFWRPRPR